MKALYHILYQTYGLKPIPESRAETCTCEKFEDENEYYIYGCFHDMVADHEPVAWCERCEIAISCGFFDIHQQFKCDNEKVGAYLKSQNRKVLAK